MIDQEDAPVPMQRFKLSALLQQTHLFDRDLAQRPVGRERDEIRMRGEQQRIVVALVGRPFLAIGDDLSIVLQAEIILFDFPCVTKQRGGKPPGQCGFSHSFGSIQQNSLRDASLARHAEQNVSDGGVAVEILEHVAMVAYLRRWT